MAVAYTSGATRNVLESAAQTGSARRKGRFSAEAACRTLARRGGIVHEGELGARSALENEAASKTVRVSAAGCLQQQDID